MKIDGQYASDDLWFLDIKNNDEASWMKVPIEGNTPGLRYGHTMVYILPILVLYGGSGKSEIMNDIWILSTDKVPFKWEKVSVLGIPNQRVYHTANIFKPHGNPEVMIVFGGRDKDNKSLADVAGLKKSLNSNDWEWIDFEKYNTKDNYSLARHQHCATFFGPFLFIVGGRVSVKEPATFDVYSMNKNKWYKFGNVALFRHSIWIYYSITTGDKYEVYMYIYGGFDGDNGSMINPDLFRINIVSLFSKVESLHYELSEYINQLLVLEWNYANTLKSSKKNPLFTMHGKVVTYQMSEDGDDTFGSMVKQLSLQKLKEEGKKIITNNMHYKKIVYDEELVEGFMRLLSLPEYFTPKEANEKFYDFEKDKVLTLIKQAKQIIEPSNMVLSVKYPIKIFGNIHGQYNDLMRYFNIFGRPAEFKGDIESFEYLFLGNYCSRGSHMLETICLLLSLKLKYPEQIHLLRGSHDDREILKYLGLAEECISKLGDTPDSKDSVFSALCDLFNYFPIAAIIKDTVLCLHSGIPEGQSIESINAIKKPYSPETNKIIADILWSQPSIYKDDYIQNNYSNQYRKLSFTNDSLTKFLTENKLNILVRSKDVIQPGFERIFNSKVITIFSATNYNGNTLNDGAVLFVKRNLELQPKVITSEEGLNTWLNKISSNFPNSPKIKSKD